MTLFKIIHIPVLESVATFITLTSAAQSVISALRVK